MFWWTKSEDSRPAGGWLCDGTSAKASREVFVIPRVRKYSIWIRPALTVKFYDDKDGTITLSEGEWRL